MNALPWLATAQQSIQAAVQADRLPHALLIHEDAGAGGLELARWTSQLLLCRDRPRAPCGACPDCQWVLAGQHPDCMSVQPEGKSRQILVDQIRTAVAELRLTGHSGRAKIAVFAPAEAINANAANALLKTLEEPTPSTLLILITAQPSRLLATIRSRCLTLRVAAPARAEAIEWLTQSRGAGPWEAALDALNTGPLSLTEVDPAAIAATRRQVIEQLGQLEQQAVEPPALAEQWAKDELELRLACTESWVTDQILTLAAAHADPTELRHRHYSPAGSWALNIGRLLEFHGAVRELRALMHTSVNKSLAVESLLWRWAQVRTR
ncbi:MAG: DNA polymerase III subunit delta' [Proteobacteria bacterium]|nr:DNA polymerase III subunit delta' [Pseudomonadota bacterium]